MANAEMDWDVVKAGVHHRLLPCSADTRLEVDPADRLCFVCGGKYLECGNNLVARTDRSFLWLYIEEREKARAARG